MRAAGRIYGQIRRFSASKTPSWVFHKSRPSLSFTHHLRDHTGHPAWNLVYDIGQNGGPVDLSRQNVVHSKDIDEAVARLGDAKPPTWLVLHMITHLVGSFTQAQTTMLNLVHSHWEDAEDELKPSVLIMAAVVLAQHNLLGLLPRLVQLFLTTPIPSASTFNLFLRAISGFRSSQELADIVLLVLSAMEARQLKLHPDTYYFLLRDRYVTMQLTKHLQAKMVREGVVPEVQHLEAYLRIFAREGNIHESKKYLEAIKKHEASYTPTVVEANTQYLRSMKADRISAFKYLDHLLDTEPTTALTLPTSNKFARAPPRSRVNIRDWTMVLSAVATDVRNVSAEALVAYFDRTPDTDRFRPNTHAYVAVLRGLYRRRNWPVAVSFLHRYLAAVSQSTSEDELVIDRFGLVVCVQLMIEAGEPHRAFDVLEALAPGIKLHTLQFNNILRSFHNAQRPDVVFALWDEMEGLYGIRPDEESLFILLQSARLSARLDDSVSGNLAELAARNPFRRRGSTSGSRTRDESSKHVRSLLQDAAGTPLAYRSGIWRGAPGWQTTRHILRSIVFTNWPELNLAHVVPPAVPVRETHDETPRFFRQHMFNRNCEHEHEHESIAPYPQIVLTDKIFLEYIKLLGLHSLAGEIPAALVWMRSLSVRPSNTTISFALVFWGEVARDTWVGEQGEYEKLERWLRQWIRKMPDERRLSVMERAVEVMRGEWFGRVHRGKR